MVRIPTGREPTHPGEMLLQEFLLPLGMTQRDLATAIHVPFQRVNEVRPQETWGNTQHGIAAFQIPRHVS